MNTARGRTSGEATMLNGLCRTIGHTPACSILAIISSHDSVAGKAAPKSLYSRLSLASHSTTTRSMCRRSPLSIRATRPFTGEQNRTRGSRLSHSSGEPASTVSPSRTSSPGTRSGKSSGYSEYSPARGKRLNTFSACPTRRMVKPLRIFISFAMLVSALLSTRKCRHYCNTILFATPK